MHHGKARFRRIAGVALAALTGTAQAAVPMHDFLTRVDGLHARCAGIRDDDGIRQWNEALLSLETDVREALHEAPRPMLKALLSKEDPTATESAFINMLAFRWGFYLPDDLPGAQRYARCPTEAMRVSHALDELSDYGWTSGQLDRQELARLSEDYQGCLAFEYQREPDQLEPRIRQHLACLHGFAATLPALGKAALP